LEGGQRPPAAEVPAAVWRMIVAEKCGEHKRSAGVPRESGGANQIDPFVGRVGR
jgi:hypothetical protein